MTSQHGWADHGIPEIATVRARWVAAINGGDPDGFAAAITDNAVWAIPGAEPLSGKSEIREWLRGAFQQFGYQYSVANVRLYTSARWAVERAEFESIVRDRSGGPRRTHRGTYTIDWRRSADQWLIERFVDEALLAGD